MLSNKWTFSLKILVVILVLALVASSAMAAEFAVTMSVGSSVDISSADGVQVKHGETTINVKFDKVVDIDTVANMKKRLQMKKVVPNSELTIFWLSPTINLEAL